MLVKHKFGHLELNILYKMNTLQQADTTESTAISLLLLIFIDDQILKLTITQEKCWGPESMVPLIYQESSLSLSSSSSSLLSLTLS